jgi:hypothetical protein
LTADQIESIGKDFVLAGDKWVVLSLRGCRPIAVNPAHGAVPKNARLVSSPAEFAAVVLREIQDQERRANSGEPPPHIACYCLDQKHVLALRLIDCVHEERFIFFLKHTRLPWLRGFEFTHTLTDEHKSRLYILSRVHAKVLHWSSGQKNAAAGIVAVRMVESQYLKVRLDGRIGQDSCRVKAALLVDGAEASDFPVETVVLDPERLGLYRDLDAALREALDVLNPGQFSEIETLTSGARVERAVARLEEFSRKVKEHGDFEEYSLTREIVQQIVEAQTAPAKMKALIEGYLHRVWDAPVLSREFRLRLENWLGTRDPLSQSDPGSDIEADIARLNTHPDALAAFDRLHPLRLAETASIA